MRLTIATALLPAFFIGVIFSGCSTVNADRIRHLQTGMTREQVIAIMGAPDHTVAVGNEENMIYYFSPGGAVQKRGYVIQLVDGKVHYFGQMLTMIVPPAPAARSSAP